MQTMICAKPAHGAIFPIDLRSRLRRWADRQMPTNCQTVKRVSSNQTETKYTRMPVGPWEPFEAVISLIATIAKMANTLPKMPTTQYDSHSGSSPCQWRGVDNCLCRFFF